MIDDEDPEEREIRTEKRADAKAALTVPWNVERHDNRDGSIAYEVWAGGYKHRICRMVDADNPTAKRDADHIVKLHNEALGK